MRPPDPASMWIHAEAGDAVADVEAALRAAGLTLGSQPPSVLRGTVGEWIEGRWAGRRAEDGRLAPGFASLEVALPGGRIFRSRAAPRTAAGPGLGALVAGGGGLCGRLVAAELKAEPVPRAVERHCFAGGRLAELVARALRLVPAPLELVFADGTVTLALRAWRPDERAVIARIHELAEASGLRPCEPPGRGADDEHGAEHELDPARLPAFEGPLRLVRCTRESCVAVGALEAPARRADDELLEAIAASLRTRRRS